MKSIVSMVAVVAAMLSVSKVAEAGDCRKAQNVVVQEVAPPVQTYVQPQAVIVQPVQVQYVQMPQRVIVQQPVQHAQRVIVQQQGFYSQPQRVIVQQQAFGGRGRQNFIGGGGGGGALNNVVESIFSPQGILTIGGAAAGAAIGGPAGGVGGAAIGAALGNVLGNGLRR